jgi:hypothetical protein
VDCFVVSFIFDIPREVGVLLLLLGHGQTEGFGGLDCFMFGVLFLNG